MIQMYNRGAVPRPPPASMAAAARTVAAALPSCLLLLLCTTCCVRGQSDIAIGSPLPFPTSWAGALVMTGPRDNGYLTVNLPSALTLWTNSGPSFDASINGIGRVGGSGNWLRPYFADLYMPAPADVPDAKMTIALLAPGSSELVQAARFLAQPLSRVQYAVLASWVKVGFWFNVANVAIESSRAAQNPNTFQVWGVACSSIAGSNATCNRRRVRGMHAAAACFPAAAVGRQGQRRRSLGVLLLRAARPAHWA